MTQHNATHMRQEIEENPHPVSRLLSEGRADIPAAGAGRAWSSSRATTSGGTGRWGS